MTTRNEWEELIKEQSASGRSVASFCRERGLSDKSFGYWVKRLSASEARASRFAAVGELTKVELHFRSGVSVRVPRDITSRELRTLAEALDAEHR